MQKTWVLNLMTVFQTKMPQMKHFKTRDALICCNFSSLEVSEEMTYRVIGDHTGEGLKNFSIYVQEQS